MAFSTDNVGDELLDSINRPFASLPELLDALMRALAERTGLAAGMLRLRGLGTLALRRSGDAVATEWRDEAPDQPAAGLGYERDAPAALVLPVVYAGAPLGELRLVFRHAMRADDPAAALLREFARHCALLAKRYEVRRWSEQRWARPLLLVGMSKALRDLERFLEISALGRLPVLLRGEFGTEKAQLAATIHCCGPRPDGPFFQVDCKDPAASPVSWAEQARGGTLFLSDVDELDPQLQRQVPQHLPSWLDQRLSPAASGEIRVIATTTADLRQRAHEGQFSRALFAELDFLSYTIPPLRDRVGDMEPLIWQMLERNGYRAEDKRTDTLVALCEAHHWPENLFELERTIARLAVMTEGRPIMRGDIHAYAPGIVAGIAGPQEAGEDEEMPGAPTDRVTRWVRFALGGADAQPGPVHEALGRALRHLGERFDEPISLAELSHHARVSASHLSYLFRRGVGVSFKALLIHIRVRKACELLMANPCENITQVALRVGFADLSHFERSFRRVTGVNPREFRRSTGRERMTGDRRHPP